MSNISSRPAGFPLTDGNRSQCDYGRLPAVTRGYRATTYTLLSYPIHFPIRPPSDRQTIGKKRSRVMASVMRTHDDRKDHYITWQMRHQPCGIQLRAFKSGVAGGIKTPTRPAGRCSRREATWEEWSGEISLSIALLSCIGKDHFLCPKSY